MDRIEAENIDSVMRRERGKNMLKQLIILILLLTVFGAIAHVLGVPGFK